MLARIEYEFCKTDVFKIKIFWITAGLNQYCGVRLVTDTGSAEMR